MGKGGRAPAVNPEVLEQRFFTAAQRLFDRVVDWNNPTNTLEGGWKQLTLLRNQVLEAYGVPTGPTGPPAPVARVPLGVAQRPRQQAAMAALPAPTPQQQDPVSWKGEFNQAWQTRAGRSITKTDVQYECKEEVGEDGTVSYVATLSAEGCSWQYLSESPAPTKKQAEILAAKAALKAEFPTEFANANRLYMQQQRMQPRISPVVAAPAAGKAQKRKFSQVEEETPKTRLFNAIPLLKGQQVEKGDLVFETRLVEGTTDQWCSTVVLQAYDPSNVYEGEIGPTKRAAENAAAEVALNALHHILEPLMEEHKVKKAAKEQEKRAQQAAKKAAAAEGA